MKILLIKLKLIGDALLLTGTARAIKRALPQAQIHVVVRKGTEGILAGCPDIDAVHTTGDKSGGSRARSRRFWALVRQLRAQRFDCVAELGDGDRGRILALLSGGRRVFANSDRFQSGFWKFLLRGAAPLERANIHAARWDLDVVALALPQLASKEPPAPVFEQSAADFSWVDSLGLSTAPVFVHPVASRAGKMWTLEGWGAVVQHLLAAGRPVILSSGPAEAEVALCRSIAEQAACGGAGQTVSGNPRCGKNIFLTEGKIGWRAVAGALYRSALYVGTDTAAMHLAAACGRPVVALFAHPPESLLSLWYPLAPHSETLMTPAADIPLTALGAAEVIAAIERVERPLAI